MALDLPALEKKIAEDLLYDMQQPLTGGGLIELDKEGRAKDTVLVEYPAWRAAFDKLVKAVGIEKSATKGMVAPKGLKPEGVSSLTFNEMRVLATFGNPDNEHGRKALQSSVASAFLGKFHVNYASPMLEIVQDHAVKNTTRKLTAFWKKHVEDMVEITKEREFRQYKDFVDGMNCLASNSSFAGSIGIGFAEGSQFDVDSEKLVAAIRNTGSSASAVSQMNSIFNTMSKTAGAEENPAWEKKLRGMQQEYLRDVSPAIAELRGLTAMLDRTHAEAAAAATYRKYT